MDINSKKKLNNGKEIPYFGLGVYRAKQGKEVESAVKWALDYGYRHFDTARAYGNERGVGKAIKESGISREEIFITTKLWNDDHGFDAALKALDASLNDLNMEYVDLYLIHWPVPDKRESSWKALEKLYKDGRAKSIGVSNYMIKHLKELLDYAEVIPVINQVEFNPFLYQKELLDFCNENKIEIEAYSPLARAKKLDDKKLKNIAEKYSKSPAQMMIRWCLQHDRITIPKSSHKERIEENAKVFDFEISKEDMEEMNSLDESYRVAWDPTKVE